eukprot:Selendium_serpulae@DN4878_c0_g1_i1.p1
MALFRASFATAELLQLIMKGLEKVSQDVEFECTAEGLFYYDTDRSQVASVCMKLADETFREYAFNCAPDGGSGGKLVVKTNTEHMSQLIRAMRPSAPLELELWASSGPLLVKSEDDNGSTWTGRLKLFDAEGQAQQLPEDELFTMTIELPSKAFANLFKDLHSFGAPTVSVVSDMDPVKNVPRLTLESSDTSSGIITAVLFSGLGDATPWECTSTFSQSYDLKFLSDVVLPFASISPKVAISFGEDETPVRLSFSINEESTLKFYLSQKRLADTQDIDLGEQDVEMGA